MALTVTEGTYSLLLSLSAPATVEVGALGPVDFDAGWYVYTGSAFGPGGFARVDRHRSVSHEGTATPHWHVDYLLPRVTLVDVYTVAGLDHECEIARGLPGERIGGFGASDCDCRSHLAFAPDERTLRDALAAAYRDGGSGETDG